MSTNFDAPPDQHSLPTAEGDLRERRLDRIAIRAFELYDARGGEHGQDLDDWLQAEKQIDYAIEKDDQIEGLDPEG
jgi:hypothetical protein